MRLTFPEWRRYRRLYRVLVVDAGRYRDPETGERVPLTRKKRGQMKGVARMAARAASAAPGPGQCQAHPPGHPDCDTTKWRQQPEDDGE